MGGYIGDKRVGVLMDGCVKVVIWKGMRDLVYRFWYWIIGRTVVMVG